MDARAGARDQRAIDMPTYVLIHGANYEQPELAVRDTAPGRRRRARRPTRARPPTGPDGRGRIRRLRCRGDRRRGEFNADDIVLVAHSAGGLTASSVVNRFPERIRAVVFVSSTIPPAGGAILDSIDPEARDAVLTGSGDGTYEIGTRCARSCVTTSTRK
jgi:pimeloyl-ACP methyl ester carboxylesterase